MSRGHEKRIRVIQEDVGNRSSLLLGSVGNRSSLLLGSVGNRSSLLLGSVRNRSSLLLGSVGNRSSLLLGSVGNRSSLLLGSVGNRSSLHRRTECFCCQSQSHSGVCRESEFPPTEELNASAAKQVSICKLCRKRAMMLSNPISLHVP